MTHDRLRLASKLTRGSGNDPLGTTRAPSIVGTWLKRAPSPARKARLGQGLLCATAHKQKSAHCVSSGTKHGPYGVNVRLQQKASKELFRPEPAGLSPHRHCKELRLPITVVDAPWSGQSLRGPWPQSHHCESSQRTQPSWQRRPPYPRPWSQGATTCA